MLAVAAAVIYVLSPIDLAPELLLGPLGLIDDAGIVIAALAFARRQARARARTGPGTDLEPGQR